MKKICPKCESEVKSQFDSKDGGFAMMIYCKCGNKYDVVHSIRRSSNVDFPYVKFEEARHLLSKWFETFDWMGPKHRKACEKPKRGFWYKGPDGGTDYQKIEGK